MTFSSRKAPFRLCVMLVLVTDILSIYAAQAITIVTTRGLPPNGMVLSLFLVCQTQCFALSPTAFITVNLCLWGSSVFALQVNTFTHKQHGCMLEPAHAVIRRFGRHLYVSCKNLTSTWGKRCRAPWNDLTFPLCVFFFKPRLTGAAVWLQF